MSGGGCDGEFCVRVWVRVLISGVGLDVPVCVLVRVVCVATRTRTGSSVAAAHPSLGIHCAPPVLEYIAVNAATSSALVRPPGMHTAQDACRVMLQSLRQL